MNHFLYIALAVGAIALSIVYGLPYLRQPSIDRLVETALNSASSAEQLEAAQELSQRGEQALDGMRKLIAECDNEEVVAMSILGVARLMDYSSMDQILVKLDDDSVNIRSAAAKATAKLLGRDHHYPVMGSAAQQTRVKKQIVKDWEAYNESELFEYNKSRFKN